MQKKKLIATVTTVALIAAVGIGSTLAYFTDNDAVSNVVTMGNVNINLYEEYKDGQETKITDEGLTFDKVVPNQTIAKVAKISVDEKSENAYIRVSLKLSSDDQNMNTAYAADIQALETAIISGIAKSDNWAVGDGGKLYYQSIVTAKDIITVLESVTIPNWGNEAANHSFKIDIQAEAIQANAFEPVSENNVIVSWGTELTSLVDAYPYVAPAAE